MIWSSPDRSRSISPMRRPDDSLPEVLPQLPPLPPPHLCASTATGTGEILRGENDELYEKIGGRIRRLRRLVSGPNGEILDVA